MLYMLYIFNCEKKVRIPYITYEYLIKIMLKLPILVL